MVARQDHSGKDCSEKNGFDKNRTVKNWKDMDKETENTVGNLLRTGVLISALVVLVGGVIYLTRHGRSSVDFRVFHGEPADLRSLRGIFHEALALRSRGIIQLGLLLLIATPIARVAFSIWAFAKERDRMYVVFTLIVFAILLYSFFGSA